MKIQDFKKQVYELAKFKSALTKGYGKEWKARWFYAVLCPVFICLIISTL